MRFKLVSERWGRHEGIAGPQKRLCIDLTASWVSTPSVMGEPSNMLKIQFREQLQSVHGSKGIFWLAGQTEASNWSQKAVKGD